MHFEQFHWVKDEKIRQRILVERAIIRRAVRDKGFKSGFCAECKESGYEARPVVAWEQYKEPA